MFPLTRDKRAPTGYDVIGTSRFDGITSLHPGAKTAFDGSDALETIANEDLRRTGARLFIRSGAVVDDPLFLIKFIQAADNLLAWE